MRLSRSRFPTFSTVSSVQPRALLLVLLLSGAVVLALASVIERPHDTEAATDDHGAATTEEHAEESAVDHASESETSSDDAHATEPPLTEDTHASDGKPDDPAVATHPTEDAHNASDPTATDDTHAQDAAHATTGANPTDEAHATAESRTAGSAGDHADSTGAAATTSDDGHDSAAAEDHAAPSLAGVDLEPLNVSAPRFVVLLLAATLLVTIAAAAIPSRGMLVAVVAVSLVGVAASVREALHAGEELGLFVRLPLLAAVLYAGAGTLAALQIAGARMQSTDEHQHGSAAHAGAASGAARSG